MKHHSSWIPIFSLGILVIMLCSQISAVSAASLSTTSKTQIENSFEFWGTNVARGDPTYTYGDITTQKLTTGTVYRTNGSIQVNLHLTYDPDGFTNVTYLTLSKSISLRYIYTDATHPRHFNDIRIDTAYKLKVSQKIGIFTTSQIISTGKEFGYSCSIYNQMTNTNTTMSQLAITNISLIIGEQTFVPYEYQQDMELPGIHVIDQAITLVYDFESIVLDRSTPTPTATSTSSSITTTNTNTTETTSTPNTRSIDGYSCGGLVIALAVGCILVIKRKLR